MIQFHRHQRTISRPVTICGIGYWTGEEVTVTFQPAAAGSGLVFIRTDRQCRVRANTTTFVETPRRTKLTENGDSVEMVEHLLAGLFGMQIDNCEICVSGGEMPAFDGSSRVIVESLVAAGIETQHEMRPCLKLEQTIQVEDGDLLIEAHPTAESGLRIAYELDYGPGPIGCQVFETAITPDAFRYKLAAARTFLLKSEADWLQSQGMGKRVSYSDLLVFGEDGPIQNRLRFENECARHKVLDIVGDLALAGIDIEARIVARKSGHRHNTKLAGLLFEQFKIDCVQLNSTRAVELAKQVA